MIIAIIPAKGESSRLPNKNMQKVHGKPLIYYAIEDAKESKLIESIYVSTDSDEIEGYARSLGINVIRRGPELGGDAMLVDVYLHALNQIDAPNAEYLVGVQADHPDRTVKFDDAIRHIKENDLDLLSSDDANGVHNGSIYILRATALRKNFFPKTGSIVDDCTNIHFAEDLKQAEERLTKQES